MTSVGIYVRISDDRAGSGLGVARQEADCRRLADTRSWTVIDVYTDNDLSAYSGKARPSYQRLLEDLTSGRIAGVVAWHPDRLHRRPVELEHFIDVIESTGATVATVQAGDLDLSTASGRMTARIVGAVARHESEHKSERHKAKARQLAVEGKNHGGGTRPFGFEPDRVTIRPDEADSIREMATRIAGGETLRSVIADFNRRGIFPPKGGPWAPSVARRMLISGRIAGQREHLGEVTADAEWPAIVDRSTWETVRRILTDPTRLQGASPRRYLLTGGLSYCSRCEARLVARPRSDGRRAYICAKGPGYSGCGKIGILAGWLEGYVVEAMLHRLDGDGLARALAGGDEGGSTAVAGELAQVEARLDDLSAMFAAGEIDRRGWLVARQGLQGRREKLAGQLANQGRRSALTKLVGPGGPRAQWEALDEFDVRRAIVATVLDRVVVGPGVRGFNRFERARLQPPKGDVIWRL